MSMKASLDVLQDLLHGLLGLFGDQLRTGDVVAVFSCVGDGVTHTCETALVDQVYDQLHLVDALEVSVSRVIASLAQCLETSLHQSADTAAQNSLFTEQVGLSLGAECGFQNAGSCAADCQTISQCQILCLAGSILLYSNQARNALACLIFRTNGVSRSLRSDHGNVNICRRNDLTEVDCETVSEHQHIARFQVRCNVLLVHCCLLFIIDQNHDDVSLLCGLCCGEYFEALCLSLCPGLAALVQTDDYSGLIAQRFLGIQCVCVTLAAVADNSDGLAIQQRQVTIFLIKYLCNMIHCERLL
jgi:hypothetical protein